MTNLSRNLGVSFAAPDLKRLLRENFRYLRRRFKQRAHPLQAIFIRCIVFYQRRLSRHTCLYQPTCSEYTKRSIHNLGVVFGLLSGICRIVRCNPFSKGGIDPAPERKSNLRWLI